jgi:hypothetical protein
MRHPLGGSRSNLQADGLKRAADAARGACRYSGPSKRRRVGVDVDDSAIDVRLGSRAAGRINPGTGRSTGSLAGLKCQILTTSRQHRCNLPYRFGCLGGTGRQGGRRSNSCRHDPRYVLGRIGHAGHSWRWPLIWNGGPGVSYIWADEAQRLRRSRRRFAVVSPGRRPIR